MKIRKLKLPIAGLAMATLLTASLMAPADAAKP